MRVALNGWYWDRPETGSGQYLRRLTNALRSHAPESEFLIFVPGDKRRDTLPNTQFIVLPVKQSALHKVWWEQVTMPQLAVKYHADLLHVPYWAPPLQCRLPTVITVHDLIPLLLPEYRGSMLVRLYTALVSTATPRARIVLTDSQASQRDIQRHLRIPDSQIRTIHLAVDDSYRSDEDAQDTLTLQSMGIKSGYILYLGGFDKRKNLSTVIRAFDIVKGACDEAVLVIAGKLPQHDTHFTPDPRRLATDAGLSQIDVHFLGFVQESTKPALYRGARLFAFPSEYEGFGYPPLEALACGTPVVGSHAASLPEVVGDAGVLLSPSDTQGLAGAMIHILTDDAFHAELQRRALKQAALFSWKTTAELTFAAYQQAIGTLQG